MNVCHVVSSIDKNSGGTTEYLRLLTAELTKFIHNIIVTTQTLNPIDFDVNVQVYLCERKIPKFSFSLELKELLHKLECNLYHGNGLWQVPVHQMSKIALKKKVPYIISTHGMLEPWSLTQGKLKKQIALKLFQYNDLAKAACIHATAPMEVENIRKLGFKNPIAMIPNGVQIEEFPKELPTKDNHPKKILFLSRIHPKKGIENLIQAWKALKPELKEGWVIEIVGNGDLVYINELKNKIRQETLDTIVQIKKPVFGKEKIELFSGASLFVLPTFSENFGIVIAEALASYTPVITTKGAPWEDLELTNSGWWIDIGVEPLKLALEEALQTSSEKLMEMGANGRKLIEKKYSMEAVANKMTRMYSWLVLKGKKPDFIYETK